MLLLLNSQLQIQSNYQRCMQLDASPFAVKYESSSRIGTCAITQLLPQGLSFVDISGLYI